MSTPQPMTPEPELSEFDRLQLQMFVTASASGRFSEWPDLRWAAKRALERIAVLERRLAVWEPSVDDVKVSSGGAACLLCGKCACKCLINSARVAQTKGGERGE